MIPTREWDNTFPAGHPRSSAFRGPTTGSFDEVSASPSFNQDRRPDAAAAMATTSRLGSARRNSDPTIAQDFRLEGKSVAGPFWRGDYAVHDQYRIHE
jgi:hypothetical protein